MNDTLAFIYGFAIGAVVQTLQFIAWVILWSGS